MLIKRGRICARQSGGKPPFPTCECDHRPRLNLDVEVIGSTSLHSQVGKGGLPPLCLAHFASFILAERFFVLLSTREA